MPAARILIVEDEAIVAHNVREMLMHFGYQVAGTAASGEQALRLAKETQPDLVLMDIRIIGPMDGVDTAEKMQAAYSVPVVYLTAFSSEVSMERTLATLPYGFVQKPFSDNILNATIRTALERRRLEVALRYSEASLRDLNETLQRRDADRSGRLERSLSELAEFNHTVAHDLRGPLGVIGSFSGMLSRDESARLSGEGRRMLSIIEQNAALMVKILDRLIEIAASGRGAGR